MSNSHLSRVMRGDKPWTIRMIQKLAVALHVSPQWLETGTGPMRPEAAGGRSRRLVMPLVGRAAADSSSGSLNVFEHPMEEYDLGANRGLVEVVGNSLAPVALSGQHVFVDLSDRTVQDGDLVVVETVRDEVYAKRAFRAGDEGLMLVSVNPLDRESSMLLRWEEIRQARVIVGVWFE